MGMPPSVNAGDVLAGKYRVERILGMGGMGVVVAATHLHLGESVAIKLLLPEAMKDPNLVARFLREARAAARIRSEHVARVHDVGVLPTGAPYLVMEHLEGSDLQELVKSSGPLPVEEAVRYLLQACEAIAEAHALGIIHRDIKPANLFLIRAADDAAMVKVIDFGISKLGDDAEAITKTVETRGSPLFMSPEQMGSARAVDARSDIWSLGVTLHNLLTGAFPFPAPTLPELCALIFQGEPVPLRQARPDAPAEVEAAILCCLAKDPARRFADVAELAASLSAFAPPDARAPADRVGRVLRGASARRRGGAAPALALVPASAAALVPADHDRPDVPHAAPIEAGGTRVHDASQAAPHGGDRPLAAFLSRAPAQEEPSRRASGSLSGAVTPARGLGAMGGAGRRAVAVGLRTVAVTAVVAALVGAIVSAGLLTARQSAPLTAQPAASSLTPASDEAPSVRTAAPASDPKEVDLPRAQGSPMPSSSVPLGERSPSSSAPARAAPSAPSRRSTAPASGLPKPSPTGKGLFRTMN